MKTALGHVLAVSPPGRTPLTRVFHSSHKSSSLSPTYPPIPRDCRCWSTTRPTRSGCGRSHRSMPNGGERASGRALASLPPRGVAAWSSGLSRRQLRLWPASTLAEKPRRSATATREALRSGSAARESFPAARATAAVDHIFYAAVCPCASKSSRKTSLVPCAAEQIDAL